MDGGPKNCSCICQLQHVGRQHKSQGPTDFNLRQCHSHCLSLLRLWLKTEWSSQEGWRLTVQMIKRREHQQFQPEEERRRERCHEIDWCDTWYIIPNGVLVSHKLRGTSQILWTGSAALKDCPAGVIEAGTNRNDTMIPVMLAFEVSVNVVWNQRINDINDQIT